MRPIDELILNPCPICGCSVRVWAKRFDEEDMEYIIECDNDFCGLAYGISCGYNRDEIKKAWNSVTAFTPTVSEDCISREQVRAKLDYISYAEKDPITMAKRIVDMAPSVMPTERTGEWVEFRKPCYDGTSYYWKKCSVCDHDMIGYETNFCPNCGAKMGGDDE